MTKFNIVTFAEKMLGVKISPMQAKILRSVMDNLRTAIAGCHASGKTFALAIVALYWVARYNDGKVLITAPGQRQVAKQLMFDIHRLIATSKFKFPVTPLQTELKLTPENFILGFTASEGVSAQGFHGANTLLIVDEAVGVSSGIYEALEGVSAGGNVHWVLAANPAIRTSYFYDAFTKNRKSWNCISISAFDSPNLEGLSLEDLLSLPDDELNLNSWPMLTTRRWTRERYSEWFYGSPSNSPLWQSRVMGVFPDDSENALFTLASLERAAATPAADDRGGDVWIGIDPAGAGTDLTVATAISGGAIIAQAAWASADPRGQAVQFVRQYGQRVRRVRIDSAGLGYGFMLHLRDTLINVAVEGTNFGEAPSNERARQRYANRKAELFGELRDLFERDGITGLPIECLSELSSLRYSLTAQGKTEIESKDRFASVGLEVLTAPTVWRSRSRRQVHGRQKI
jgi:terminase large subunit-like protein